MKQHYATNANIVERAYYHLSLSSRSPTIHFTLDTKFHTCYIFKQITRNITIARLKSSKDDNYVLMLGKNLTNYT